MLTQKILHGLPLDKKRHDGGGLYFRKSSDNKGKWKYINLTKSLSTSLLAKIGFIKRGRPIRPSVYEPPEVGIIREFLNQDLDNKTVAETIKIKRAIKIDKLSFLFKNFGNCWTCCQVGILRGLNLSNSFLLRSFS